MMRTAYRAPVAAASLLLVFAACDRTPAEPTGMTSARPLAAVTSADEQTRPIDEYVEELEGKSVIAYCDDGSESEPILLKGSIRHRSQYVGVPTGTVHFRAQSIPVDAYGVGAETGQEYRFVERERSWGHYAESGIIGLERSQWTLRNVETQETFGLTYTVRYTMDADRELVMHREWEKAVCKR